ncbi:MAG: hypothetical protein ACUVTM_01365 [Candidatus Bathyarchaeia archaeon]
MANVTSTNFYIAFLYFANGSNRADMILFEYESALYRKISFVGRCMVENSSTIVKRPITPRLTLEAKAKIENKLFATGPDLYLIGDTGYLKYNSSVLDLYTLRNTLNPSSGWNELWTLLKGQPGEYYFSIIYMNMQVMDKVILGHTLRLNDFYVIEQKQLKAIWRVKQNIYKLMVNAPKEVETFWIDKFQFQRRSSDALILTVDGGNHTICAANSTIGNLGVRLRFSRWSCGSTSNPLTLRINSSITISAEYTKEYLLIVNSSIPGVTGGGWYPEGVKAQVKAPDALVKGDVKYAFEGWLGDVKIEDGTPTVIMDAPKTIVAKWSTFFRVNLTAEGLPKNIELDYSLNNTNITSRPYQVVQYWVKERSWLNFSVYLRNDTARTQYPTTYWTDSKGNKLTSPILITAPERLTARFTTQKHITNLTCRVSTSSLLNTGMLSIGGQITPALKTKITVEYRVSGEPWRVLKEVETDQVGNYHLGWTPNITGIFQIRARFVGDPSHSECVSDIKEVAVSLSVIKFRRLASVFNSSTSTLYEEIRAPQAFRNTLLAPFAFGIDMLSVVYSTLSEVRPLGPIATIILGSTILSLIYILPLTITLSILFLVIAKRPVNRKILYPFIIIWAIGICYLLLGELNAIQLLQLPNYSDNLFIVILAISTIGLVALAPSVAISGTIARKWRINPK